MGQSAILLKDPASVADKFVDRYYVESDQDSALPLTTGVATLRLEEELKLTAEARRGQSGMPGNEYADGMLEHDQDVGKLLKKLDDLGIKDDTIVIYSTDNGPNQFSWPDAASTPFRSTSG